jgi:hypothetical protein
MRAVLSSKPRAGEQTTPNAVVTLLDNFVYVGNMLLNKLLLLLLPLLFLLKPRFFLCGKL